MNWGKMPRDSSILPSKISIMEIMNKAPSTIFERNLFSNNPKCNFKLKIANHDAFAHLFMRVYEQIMRQKSQFTAVKKSTFLSSPVFPYGDTQYYN